MKKALIFIIIIFSILGITVFVNGQSVKYTEINYQQLKTKMDNKETFVLLLGSDTCSACANYEVTMQKVMKDTKIEIFYVNLHNLSEEDYSKVYSKFVVKSTPTTIFIKDGEETTTYNRIIGAADYNTVVDKLKSLGYIGD